VLAVAREGPPESTRPQQGNEVTTTEDTDPWPPTFRGSTEVVATRVLRDAEEAGRREVVLTREEIASMPVVGRLSWQRLGVVWLDSEIGVDPARSAYALAHPRVEASWSGAVDLGHSWNAGWVARFRDPQDGGSWGILDCRLGRRILDEMSLSLEVANVFDRQVSELHGIPLPGRWMSLLVGFGLGGS